MWALPPQTELQFSPLGSDNDGFYESSLGNMTVCHPECGEWEEFSHGTVVAVNAVIIIQAVVYFISGAVVLVLSILRRHHM